MSISSAVCTSASLLVPVHTTFPLLNSRKVAFASMSLYTRPGNCSGSYSVLSNANEIVFHVIEHGYSSEDEMLLFVSGLSSYSKNVPAPELK